jgi:hypothetical protein
VRPFPNERRRCSLKIFFVDSPQRKLRRLDSLEIYWEHVSGSTFVWDSGLRTQFPPSTLGIHGFAVFEMRVTESRTFSREVGWDSPNHFPQRGPTAQALMRLVYLGQQLQVNATQPVMFSI